MNGQPQHGGKSASRRSFLKKVGVGLLAFIPAARALATSNSEFTYAATATGVVPKIDITLAGLALRDELTTVASRLGQPSGKDVAQGHGGQQWRYSGITVNFDDADDASSRVRQILVSSPSAGGTSSGIKVGVREADVRRAHGNARKAPEGEDLVVDLAPGKSLVFTFTAGVVSGISLQEDACPNCVAPEFPPREHP